MKTILTGTLITLFTIQLHAQTAETRTKNGYISVSIGPVFAIGDFGDNSSSNEDSGLAEEGFQLNLINFGYLFSENFGISALWAGAAHTIDKDIFTSLDNDPIWSYGVVMVGPLISFPSSTGDLEFDIRALVGFLNANSPEFESGSSRLESYTGNAAAFDLGVGLRYHLSEKISFASTLDYISSKPEFEDGGFEQSITAINLTVGISFRLN